MSKKLKRLNTGKPKPNSNKKKEARKRARTNRFLRKKLKKEALKESVEKKNPKKSLGGKFMFKKYKNPRNSVSFPTNLKSSWLKKNANITSLNKSNQQRFYKITKNLEPPNLFEPAPVLNSELGNLNLF